jgi:cellobiose transport system permease protein
MPYLIIAPFFILFSVFGIYPLIYGLWMSITQWSRDVPGSASLITPENFMLLFGDEYFLNALKNTVGIGLLATIPQLVIALWLAHVLNHKLRFKTFYRMGLLMPFVTSGVAVAIIFGNLFGRDYGLVNWLFGLVGIGPIDWQAETWSSWLAIATMITWRWLGYNALFYLAALQAVSKDLYEAAEVDGASKFQQFVNITIPSLKKTILFTVTMSTIGTIQLFEEPLIYGGVNGGSDRQFQTLTMYSYENFWSIGHYAYAAAISVVMAIIIMIGAKGLTTLIDRIIPSSDDEEKKKEGGEESCLA